MKRSEMLNIIWESINEVEDADHLLTRLERAGMLPPGYETVKTIIYPPFANNELVVVNAWEPEDE